MAAAPQRSIERRLLAAIVGALSIGALAIIGVVYLVTLDEMDEIFDENLKQVALAASSHHRFDGTAGQQPTRAQLPPLARVYEEPGDFDFVTLAWSRDGRRRYASEPGIGLPFSAATGLASVRSGGAEWRVYTVVRDDGVLQAAQRVASRRALAGGVASAIFAPLLVLVALTGALLVAALRRGLAPLDAAAASVAERSAASLDPIDEASLPREIHPLIESINGLMARLSETLDLQRRFIADAAHELRSPITVLRLQMQALERARDAGSRERAAADLRAGIERAQRLIEQLLSLSRVGPEAPLPRLAPVDLSELAREAVARHAAEADHHGIDLGAEAAEPVAAQGDRQQLGVLLDNLVANAVRYTPRGGTVDVQVLRHEGQPALRVVDDGPGIPEAERARVFDRFYRGEGANSDARQSGSGLGLAIVQAIARRHGAALSLHTPAGGRGIEVRVVLPSTA